MIEAVIKTGYHGTTDKCAHSIISTKTFYFSKKENEWLGKGIYFFSDYNRAVWWAETEVRKTKNVGCSPSVITVHISCHKEEFFDLDDINNMRKMVRELDALKEEGAKKGTGFPDFDTEEEMRNFYCNLYKIHNKQIKVIAYTFPIKINVNSLGFSYVIKQKQYCVSDNNNINILRAEDKYDVI